MYRSRPMREGGRGGRRARFYSTTEGQVPDDSQLQISGGEVTAVAGNDLLHRVFDAQLAFFEFNLKEDVVVAQVRGIGKLLELRFVLGMLLSKLLKFGIAGQQVFADFPGRDGHQFPPRLWKKTANGGNVAQGRGESQEKRRRRRESKADPSSATADSG